MCNEEKIEAEIKEIKNKLYETYGNGNKVTDAIGNYCTIIESLLFNFGSKELYDRGINKLNDLLTSKISLEEFIELKNRESKKLDELLRNIINGEIELTEKVRLEIVQEFKNFITQ